MNQKIKNFWNWFEVNQYKYLFVNDIEDKSELERLMDEFHQALSKYSDELSFEIGGSEQAEKLELIISAEGVKENFPLVEALVDAAPNHKDWHFIKFKPPGGEGFELEIAGKIFNPKDIIVIPLRNDDLPNAVGLEICYPDFNKEEEELYWTATFIMIDNILGEKSAVLDIEYIDIIQTPEDLTEFDFLHLNNLREFVNEVKERD